MCGTISDLCTCGRYRLRNRPCEPVAGDILGRCQYHPNDFQVDDKLCGIFFCCNESSDGQVYLALHMLKNALKAAQTHYSNILYPDLNNPAPAADQNDLQDARARLHVYTNWVVFADRLTMLVDNTVPTGPLPLRPLLPSMGMTSTMATTQSLMPLNQLRDHYEHLHFPPVVRGARTAPALGNQGNPRPPPGGGGGGGGEGGSGGERGGGRDEGGDGSGGGDEGVDEGDPGRDGDDDGSRPEPSQPVSIYYPSPRRTRSKGPVPGSTVAGAPALNNPNSAAPPQPNAPVVKPAKGKTKAAGSKKQPSVSETTSATTTNTEPPSKRPRSNAAPTIKRGSRDGPLRPLQPVPPTSSVVNAGSAAATTTAAVGTAPAPMLPQQLPQRPPQRPPQQLPQQPPQLPMQANGQMDMSRIPPGRAQQLYRYFETEKAKIQAASETVPVSEQSGPAHAVAQRPAMPVYNDAQQRFLQTLWQNETALRMRAEHDLQALRALESQRARQVQEARGAQGSQGARETQHPQHPQHLQHLQHPQHPQHSQQSQHHQQSQHPHHLQYPQNLQHTQQSQPTFGQFITPANPIEQRLPGLQTSRSMLPPPVPHKPAQSQATSRQMPTPQSPTKQGLLGQNNPGTVQTHNLSKQSHQQNTTVTGYFPPDYNVNRAGGRVVSQSVSPRSTVPPTNTPLVPPVQTISLQKFQRLEDYINSQTQPPPTGVLGKRPAPTSEATAATTDPTGAPAAKRQRMLQPGEPTIRMSPLVIATTAATQNALGATTTATTQNNDPNRGINPKVLHPRTPIDYGSYESTDRDERATMADEILARDQSALSEPAESEGNAEPDPGAEGEYENDYNYNYNAEAEPTVEAQDNANGDTDAEDQVKDPNEAVVNADDADDDNGQTRYFNDAFEDLFGGWDGNASLTQAEEEQIASFVP